MGRRICCSTLSAVLIWRHPRRSVAPLLSALLLALPVPAWAEYIAERGDVLEIGVPGVPTLNRRAPIHAGGQILMPLIGEIDAAGLSLGQLRAKLSQILIAKNIIRDPEVTVDVAEYRPVYVAGDVVKPGAYTYRPGMTVRDAAALAGGYDLLRLRGRDPMLEGADARGEYQASAVELAKQSARAARLRTELAGRAEMDLKDLLALPVQPALVTEIAQIEAQQLAADREDSEREKAYLSRTIKATQEQLAALRQQQEHGAVAVDQQLKTLARARDLMQKGLLQAVRMEDDQRAVAAAQRQLFEVQARAAQARRDLEDGSRKLQTADDQRRIRLLQELREAVSQAATARTRLEAAAEKLRFTGAAQLRRASTAPNDPPQVAIHRVVNGAEHSTEGAEGTKLVPGDNLQITTTAEMDMLLIGFGSANSVPLTSAPKPPTGPGPAGPHK